MSRHPLWPMLIGFALGLVAGDLAIPWWLPAALAGLSLARRLPRVSLPGVSLLLAAASAGCLATPIPAPSLGEDGLISIEARVTTAPDPPRHRDASQRFTIRHQDWLLDVIAQGPLPPMSPGDKVALRGRFRPFPSPRNPGERDRYRHLIRRGFGGRLSISHPSHCEVLVPGSPWDLRRVAHACRLEVLTRLRDRLDAPTAALASALLLGARSDVDHDWLERFRDTGTYHYLAVSGLHLGLVLGGWRLFLSAMRVGRRPRGILTALGALFFAAIVGFTPSVVRASSMAILYAAADTLGRPVRSGDIVPASALLVLVLDPAQLFSLGFQFSLAAVSGIVFLRPRLLQILWPERTLMPAGLSVWGGIRARARDSVLVSIGAMLSTAPLSVYFFSQFVPWTPITSLALLPWLASFLFVSVMTLIGPIALPGILAKAHVQLLDRGLRLMDHLPATPLHTEAPPLLAVFIFGLSLVLLARGSIRMSLTLATVSLLVPSPAKEPSANAARLTVLSVSHGLCCVLQDDSGHAVVYDGGSLNIGRVGQRVLTPSLQALGVERISLLIVSHWDADHVNGLAALAQSIPIEEAWLPNDKDPRPQTQEFFQALSSSTRVRFASDPTLDWRVDGMEITAFRLVEPHQIATNRHSMIADIQARGARILIPGDLQSPELARLMDARPSSDFDVVVLPHHGRPDPWLEPLIQAMTPEISIASNGRRARKLRWSGGRGRLMETRNLGAITVLIEGNRVEARGYLER